MDENPQGPVGLQLDRAHSARVYDYLLGGRTNFAADRELAGSVLAIYPEADAAARAHRAFVRRATRHLAERGLRQFLDVGVGIPHAPNLHQTAQDVAPDCRIVYVDHDPIVLAHTRALMRSSAEGQVACLNSDLTSPQELIDAVVQDGTLDLRRPVALSLCGVLPFLATLDAADDAVKYLGKQFVPDSTLMLTHATAELNPGTMSRVAEIYQRARIALHLRSFQQVEAFFDGWDLLEPGVRTTASWHPDGLAEISDAVASCYVGIAVKASDCVGDIAMFDHLSGIRCAGDLRNQDV